eukprot:scaffold1120_cov142-Amphora_coffeaeformis.AAC.4
MAGSYVPPHKRRTATPSSSSAAPAPAPAAAAFPSSSSSRGRAPMPLQRFRAPMPLAASAPTCSYTFFGDSFVRLFSLVENPSIRIKAFKGASAKGLGRVDNINRAQITRECATARATDRFIFSFGSVDVHLSYYHKTYVLGEDMDLEDIAARYVEFVASLDTPAKKTIVGVYPSPVDDEKVVLSLLNYGSLSEEKADTVAASDDVKLAVRQGRVKTFNRALATHCRTHGIQYDDLLDEMLDDSGLQIREQFRDVSDHNIHIVWETTILEWLEKWPWLKELAPASFHEKSEQTLREYLKTKPWAERTHVSQMES